MRGIKGWRVAAAASSVGLVAGVLSAGAAQAAVIHHPGIKKTVVMHGYHCTKTATVRNPVVTGNPGDVVCGVSGKDTLQASGSNVVLIAGRGKDTLIASSVPGSVDTLIGGKGRDTFVTGGTGSDVVLTGTGQDTIDCTSGGQVTITGADAGDQENDCTGPGDQNVSQYWHGSVTAVASDGSTVTVAVSDSNDVAQAWLQVQSPACALGAMVFDLTTTPADVQVDGGGTLAAGDDVAIEADAGSVNCEPVAVNVWAQQPDSQQGAQGDTSQNWEGTIGALASDGSTMTVSVSDSSDGAQAWLQAQNPACDTSNLVFDLKSTPATIQVDGGGPLAVGDQVEVEATSGAMNCIPVAVTVNAEPADGGGGSGWSGGGGSGWSGGGGDGSGAFGIVTSVNGDSSSAACGTAGADGSFVLTSPWSTTSTTVDVSGTTTNFESLGVEGATFANVCVGDMAGALGTLASGTVTASWVFTAAPGSFPTGGGGGGSGD